MIAFVKKHVLIVVTAWGCLVGCAQPRPPLIAEQTDNHSVEFTLPGSWGGSQQASAVPEQWLDELATPYLVRAAERALANNYQLSQQALQVAIAQNQVNLKRADRLPNLNLSLSGQRFRPLGSDATRDAEISEQVDVAATMNFELDLWGKLSDAQRQAKLNLASQRSLYLDAERRLVAQVASSTFNVISAQQLQQVFQQRLSNLSQGLDVIERGYRSGLSEALDVYLAQNTVEQERANVAKQQQVRFEAATDLQLLTADYPDADINVVDSLPELPALPGTGVPADLLTRRPDIQSAWLSLLAADAGLAVAHKSRFPSLDLSASLRDADSAVSRLLDGGSLAFTVGASLLQPLFTGGRLRTLVDQARLQVAQAEESYLDTVYRAIAEVENELHRANSLEARYDAFTKAQSNAEAALTLAFDQYQKGLVNFTTVLEAQRRAFDAQTTVVQLRNQRLQSRIALLLALGGDY